MQLQVLTNTSAGTARTCQRKYFYRYVLGWSPVSGRHALRFGTAFHKGLEVYNKVFDPEHAVGAAIEGWDGHDAETLSQLLAGHFWRYSEQRLSVVESELTFEMPLINPDTGARSRTWVLRGKIDALVKTDSGFAVLEYKTAGEDITPSSAYWLRLRGDAQVSLYILAARQLGYQTSTVLYDVTRKPTISPYQATPMESRKFTKDGRLYANQREVDETPEAWGERLLADIGERPDHYYARREVSRLESDLEDFQRELWQQSRQLADAHRLGRWFRNVNRWNCNNCDFSGPCLEGLSTDTVPVGFEVLDNVHPELEEV